MTSTDKQPAPDLATGDALFDAYNAQLTEGNVPLLGHLVMYSVHQGAVTHDDLTTWFAELDLDPGYLPPPLRNIDAFERITGPDGVRTTYLVDNPTTPQQPKGLGERRRREPGGRTATLMIRPVRRDGEKIVRHVVREERNEQESRLSYRTHMAEVLFERYDSFAAAEGEGKLHIVPDNRAINKLGDAEAAAVRAMLDEVADAYEDACSFLSSNALRAIVRTMIEHLSAIRIRSGVYFVPRQHAKVLGAVRQLVSRFGNESALVRVPIPDQDEMRDMIVSAFATKASTDLEKLAADIAAAMREPAGKGKDTKIAKLHKRFTELKEATAEHSQLLSTSLDDTTAALSLVQVQLAGLLTAAADEDDDEDEES